MKFARYLQDTQTPEWKKAYIDYRGLKKRIASIRRWQEGLEPLSSSSADEEDPSAEVAIKLPVASSSHHASASVIYEAPNMDGMEEPGPSLERDKHTDGDDETLRESEIERPKIVHIKTSTRRSQTVPNPVGNTFSSPAHTPVRKTTIHRPQLTPFSTSTRPHSISHSQATPLHALLPTLPPVHITFFKYLDKQLEKIDKFYSEREKEAQARSKELEIQLRELKDHRKLFYEAHPNTGLYWTETLKSNFQSLPGTLSRTPLNPKPVVSTLRQRIQLPTVAKGKPDDNDRGGEATEVELSQSSAKGRDHTDFDDEETQHTDSHGTATATKVSEAQGLANLAPLDPEEYQHAKKKLKRALLEHYRGLEVLSNYRILNITGFRKALKKYEKVTNIPAQKTYMTEKVETSAFSSGASVDVMLRQAEELFAARFERGDKKRAMTRLRAASEPRSHHLSTFRSGFAIGLALPVLASGIYQSFQAERRAEIPAWDILLFIYSVLLIPVLFSLMVGVNFWIWSNARINYAFIFDLDVRTRLHPSQYFEIPAILLATLIYAFWLSFSHISTPTIWPIVWLGFALGLMVNPIPVLFRSSRWWLIKSVGELLISGFHQVEFTDFWMGDQFCSLVFTLSNLYFTFCAYAHKFQPTVWETCGTQSQKGWLVAFVLAMLPLLARLIQSVRRYADSKLVTHLINGGKYGSGIIYYFFYYLWRHHGVTDRGGSFVLWCLFGAVYSIYACTWDFLMDWSFFKPRSRYPLLRPELVYTNEIPFYYFTLVSNILIRFIWVFYIPERGPSITLRTFIGGMLEMLRRWQWNFFRLENEHLGNMDQYRVTREVPLPYRFDETAHEEEDDADEDGIVHKGWLRGQRTFSTNLKKVSRPDDESHIG